MHTTTQLRQASPPTQPEETIGGAELRTLIAALALTPQDLATVLGIAQRSVRRWCENRTPVPPTIADQVEKIEDAFYDAVDQMVAHLRHQSDPVAVVYRTDEELWAAHPTLRPFPARFWQAIAYQAARAVPETTFTYATTRSTP